MNDLADLIYEIASEMKEMFYRSEVDNFHKFRTFMSGCKNNTIFPNGVIFEGVSDEPQFIRGPSAAQDLTVPILDTFLGISDNFPNNELTKLLNEYRNHIPKSNIEYLQNLKK
jgi:indoleamine 2,3-dioxygenase